MDENFNYSNVPNGFLHCLNASCQFADSCMRYQVGIRVPATCKNILIVNPTYVFSKKKCPVFLPKESLYYAYGIDHLYDDIPYGIAVKIKQQLIVAYGKNLYYRFKRKERYLTPKEQDHIWSVFKTFGIEQKPQFDSYEEAYRWG